MNLIFDLDGTLIDSKKGVLISLEYVLNKNKVKRKCALSAELIGPPLYELLTSVVGQADHNIYELVEQFVCHYDSEGYLETLYFDGVFELLEAVKKKGFRLFIATNKRQVPTEKIVKLFGWNSLFEGVYSIDSIFGVENKSDLLVYIVNNYDLSAESTIYIGDTEADRSTAADVGVKYLMVSWGYGSIDTSMNDVVDNPMQMLDKLSMLDGLADY